MINVKEYLDEHNMSKYRYSSNGDMWAALQKEFDDAAQWIESIDRSVLGRYAVDDDLLHIAYVLTNDDLLKRDGFYSHDHRRILIDMIDADDRWNSYATFSDNLPVPYYMEVAFWWLRDNSHPDRLQHAKELVSRVKTPNVPEVIRLMNTIVDNPTTHLPYYEADIWDEELIIRCVSTGVDASLVNSIL